MELEQVAGWLWCLRTPIVQAYAVRERDGFNLIDSSTAGQDDAILAVLAGIDGRPLERVRVYGLLLTHGHDDHTGSAAALAARTGARVAAPRDDAPVITGERPGPAPQLADWEVPLFRQVMPNVPQAPPVVPDRLVAHGDRLGWQHDAVIMGAPGHTPGHVAAWFEQDRVLVAGDALASHDGRPMVGYSTPIQRPPPQPRSALPRSMPKWRASGTASRCAATRPPGSPRSWVGHSPARAARADPVWCAAQRHLRLKPHARAAQQI
jgi:glyoxylase-like metal-dependent hydrolase (beta-lactamase superfamily II)